jgi:hypothetical protein
MKSKASAFALLALVIGLTASVHAQESAWLLGKWELAYDPDNNPKDWLEFSADGHAVSITAEGRRIPGRYVLNDRQINVTYSYNGKMIPYVLKFSAEKDTLIAYSEKTKNTSLYRKVKEQAPGTESSTEPKAPSH